MLDLLSQEWKQLKTAYGTADEIPSLLRQLSSLPNSNTTTEPWFSLWSALAHQGEVYSASIAAVPHVVSVLSRRSQVAPADFFLFPAWVEICRKKGALEAPLFLKAAYEDAVIGLRNAACNALMVKTTQDIMRAAMAAIAVADDQHSIAEAILDLDNETLRDFRLWFESR